MNNVFYTNNIISSEQFGFRKEVVTKLEIVTLTDFLYIHLDKSEPVLGTFLDFAKAFDTVNQVILLNKLELETTH